MSVLYQIPGISLTALCHVIVIYYMAERRYCKKKFVLYSCIYFICFVSLTGYAFAMGIASAYVPYTAVVICTFLFSCMVSRDCFSKKCFLFISYFCLFSVLDNVLRLMIKIFLPQLSAMGEYYAVLLLRNVILLLLLVLYRRYAIAIFRILRDNSRRWWNLALIALLFYLMQVVVSFLNAGNAMSDMFLLLSFAAISTVMCAVYGVVFSNISYMKKDVEAALIQQNAEYLSERLSVLQNAEETNRRLRHDMRHHIETIAEYAKTGDTSAILTYIGEYRNEISEAAVKQYSVNKTVNSILSAYAGKTRESGIDLSVKCNVPKELKVRETDLIALLGNLLENALHGCQESGKENPDIKIHIRLQNSRLIILCNNTCPDHLKLFGGLPAGKSIGISSILSVCRKYDGNLDYKIEAGSCSACAVLNV